MPLPTTERCGYFTATARTCQTGWQARGTDIGGGTLASDGSRQRGSGRGAPWWWLVLAGTLLLVTACASGSAVRRLPPAAVGPAPADAQLVVTLRQPLVADLMAQPGPDGALPSQLTEDAERLGRSTERIVLSLLPQRRAAVLALVPHTTYPAELIGWQLNLSDLQFHGGGDSGVLRYWSDPDAGFGILVFPNLIFSFWLAPYDFVAGATGSDPAPAVREMIRVARRGAGVPLHPAAAELSAAHLFAYLQDVAAFAIHLSEVTPNAARAMSRLPAEAAWAAGELAGPEPAQQVALQAGVALRTDDLAPYLALTRLLVVNLLARLDLLGEASLREVEVGPGVPGTVAVTGLRLARRTLAELMRRVLGGEDDAS